MKMTDVPTRESKVKRSIFLIPLLLLALAVFAYSPTPVDATAPSNQAVLYRSATNTCLLPTGGGTCSVTISVTYGDLLIVAVQGQTSTLPVTDSLATNFGSESNGVAEELWGQLASSGADTVQLSSTVAGQVSVEVMEVRGVFTDYVVTTGTSSGTGAALSTTSTSYSGFTWFCAASTNGAGPIAAGTNYALIVNPNYPSFAAEYSTTVPSPTTFPATSAISGTWDDVGACFARSVIHPSDVQINQWPSSNYFYVNEYKNSYLSVGFANTVPTLVSPVTVPQLDSTITGSNLLTMYLGGTAYFDTLIPSTNNTFYLPDPATANAYTINVQDLSGTFSQGASVYVQFGRQVMASGYLDASNDFDVWLPQGYYNATLVSGSNTYKTYLSMPAASGSTVPIQILKLTVNGNCGVCTTGWNAGFDSGLTHILFGFKDSSTTTTSVNDSVFVTNSTYPLGHRFYTHLFSAGPYGTITDTISCASDNCNSSIAQDISVRVIYTDSYGTFTYYVPVTNAGLFASTPNIPSGLLGLSSLFGSGAGAPTWLSMSAYFVILISTTVFGAYSAKFGVIPASALAAVFTYAGWLPLTGGAAVFLIAMAVTAFIGFLQHGR